MNKEERIRELALDMDYGCTKRDLYPDDAKEIAKALDILGYRKIVWHKVQDGDLPKDYEHRFLTVNDKGYYEVANFDKNGNFWVYDEYCHKYVLSGIIAWTELPTYEE